MLIDIILANPTLSMIATTTGADKAQTEQKWDGGGAGLHDRDHKRQQMAASLLRSCCEAYSSSLGASAYPSAPRSPPAPVKSRHLPLNSSESGRPPYE